MSELDLLSLRVQRAEQGYTADTSVVRDLITEVRRLRGERDQLRTALDWYAQEHVYLVTQAKEPRSAVHGDNGERAREALAAATSEDTDNK